MTIKQKKSKNTLILGIWNYSCLNLGCDKVVTESESSGRVGKNFEKNNWPIKKLVECLHNSERGQLKNFGVSTQPCL